MAKKTKAPKPKPVLKDHFGQTVKEGDTVVLLWKVRGYRKLEDARLITTTYLGKGQYGYMFGSPRDKNPPAIRTPEVVKVNDKKVTKLVESAGLKKEVAL